MKTKKFSKNRKLRGSSRKNQKGSKSDHNSPELKWLEAEIEKTQRLINLLLQQNSKNDVTDYEVDLNWFKDVKEKITNIQNQILDKDEQINKLEAERNELEQDPLYQNIKNVVYA